jgi:hypothetical protein
MAARAQACANCGTQSVAMKRCVACKTTTYCGAACQKADWKNHKKSCGTPVVDRVIEHRWLGDVPPEGELPPASLDEIDKKITAAWMADDWRGVLQWDFFLDELLAWGTFQFEDMTLCFSARLLGVFSDAHKLAYTESGNASENIEEAKISIALAKRRVPILGQLGRFMEQGHNMCWIGHVEWITLSTDADSWYERAIKVGKEHHLYEVESTALEGLGCIRCTQGHPDGVGMLRNAHLAAMQVTNPRYEIQALHSLVDALIQRTLIPEAWPLLRRLLTLAVDVTASEHHATGVSVDEVLAILFAASIHEVIRIHTRVVARSI